MEKSKKIFIRLLIVLLSLISADGGRSFVLTGYSLQIFMSHDHHNDAELPHNHHFVNLIDDEKWINPICNNLVSISVFQNCYLDNQDALLEEYSGSIWQPPKFM